MKIPHAWWDAGDNFAWHSGGISGTLHVFVQASEIHCDPWFCGGLLRDHHHRVAPCEGLANRDLLNHPFGDHGGELGLDGRAPLERNSASPIVAARDCVIPEVNVHIGGPVIQRNGASSKTVGNSAMMDAFRMVDVTSESGSAAVEDGVGVAPSGGWGAVLSAAAGSREWGQPSSRRPRLMQVDLLSNDTFRWPYT